MFCSAVFVLSYSVHRLTCREHLPHIPQIPKTSRYYYSFIPFALNNVTWFTVVVSTAVSSLAIMSFIAASSICILICAFYRAMVRSARYCYGKLSVCPSITLRYCDHIGWNSSKIISPLISLGCLLFADPTSWTYSKENTRKL